MKNQDWAAIRNSLAGGLSDEESRIIELLIDGKTMLEIGQILDQHRSMIWRKMQKIKKRNRERLSTAAPPRA